MKGTGLSLKKGRGVSIEGKRAKGGGGLYWKSKNHLFEKMRKESRWGEVARPCRPGGSGWWGRRVNFGEKCTNVEGICKKAV